MTLLALDLGTDCGFAIYKEEKFINGTKKLGTYKDGERFYEFRKWLLNIIAKHNIEAVYFERVFEHKGTEAGHCFSGFMYMLASVRFQQKIHCVSFSVQAIKKFITAKGNATKNEIISAVKRKGFNPETEDEADAIAIMLFVLDDITDKNQNQNTTKSWERVDAKLPTTSLA